MIQQTTFRLTERRRGCHLITHEITEHLPGPLPQAGMLNLFVQHTSCALTINENAAPDVRSDMMIMVRMLQPTPEGLPVELYCFCAFVDWVPFEKFQSSVLDYAVVMAREFGLRVFQRPAGTDLKDEAVKA